MAQNDVERFARQIALFGKEGQAKIAATSVAVVGIGGLGTHVVQQLAYLGTHRFSLIDDEELDGTNLNRYIGARHDDPIPGTKKVAIGERLIRAITPSAEIDQIPETVLSARAFDAMKPADAVFGCVDNEGTRLVLNEFTSAYGLPYFDLATEILPGEPLVYGGRLVVAADRPGCIACLGELDLQEAALDLGEPERRAEHNRLYGLPEAARGASGPSVVSLNGVVASLGVTEFMVHVSGLRAAHQRLTYRAGLGIVTKSSERANQCFTCSLAGLKEAANVERYIRPDPLNGPSK